MLEVGPGASYFDIVGTTVVLILIFLDYGAGKNMIRTQNKQSPTQPVVGAKGSGSQPPNTVASAL